MNGIIIVFSKLEDAKKIQSVLNRNGYEETTACSTGAQVLGHLSRYTGGIVICGYRLADMYYTELNEYLPENFKMLLIGSSRAISQCEASIVSVEVPLKVYDLINTVQILWGGGGQSRRTGAKSKRSASDRAVIDKAKETPDGSETTSASRMPITICRKSVWTQGDPWWRPPGWCCV